MRAAVAPRFVTEAEAWRCCASAWPPLARSGVSAAAAASTRLTSGRRSKAARAPTRSLLAAVGVRRALISWRRSHDLSPNRPVIDLNVRGIETTPLWEELITIRIGHPWTETAIAGLQFYDYGTPGLSGEPIAPGLGDRHVLVRCRTTKTTRTRRSLVEE